MTLFSPGDSVRVRDAWPELQGRVHIRTPHYVRGCVGTVIRLMGSFRNPEDLAFGRPAATLPLYHISFRPMDIWPDSGSSDELLIEIYEPWLEKMA